MTFLQVYFLIVFIFSFCYTYQTPDHNNYHDYHHGGQPQEIMVDVINRLGLNLLAIHNENNNNNIAISPYGATSVLVALQEGVRGDAEREIQNAAGIPRDISIVRIGLRDIHRYLKSYFIPKEGFLAGLTLSHDNVTLLPEYESILRFYGYDVDSFNSAFYPDPSTTMKPESSSTESSTTNSIAETTTVNTSEMTTEEEIETPTTEITTTEMNEIKTSKSEELTSIIGSTENMETTTKLDSVNAASTNIPLTTLKTNENTEENDEKTTTIVETPTTEKAIKESTTEKATEELTTEKTTEESTTEKATEESTTEKTTEEATTEKATEEATTEKATEESTTEKLIEESTTATTIEYTSGLLTTEMNEKTTVKSVESTIPVTTASGDSGYSVEEITSNNPTTTMESTTEETTITTTNFPTETVSTSTESASETTVISTEQPETIAKSLNKLDSLSITEFSTVNPKSEVEIISTITETTATQTSGKEDTTVNSAILLRNIRPMKIIESKSTNFVDLNEKKIIEATTKFESRKVSAFDGTTTQNSEQNYDEVTENEASTSENSSTEENSSTSYYYDSDETENSSAESSEETTDDPLKRDIRSVVDYIIARYYDNYQVPNNEDPYKPNEHLSFLVDGKYKESNISFMTYDTVLPFYYISHLNTLALSFPLDSTKYYLLLLLPVHEKGVDKLICDLQRSSDLKHIIAKLKYTHVKAIIPSFMLKGYVILTPTLQKLGIRRIFEPRHADFSPMTEEKDIYVTNIEQAITVTIRNYVDPSKMQSHRNLYQHSPVEFKADHPFLYFVIDSEIHVTLMAGKIINPLNSRIR